MKILIEIFCQKNILKYRNILPLLWPLSRLGLDIGRVDEDTNGEKDGDRNADEFEFLSSQEKPFGVGKLVQRVCV